MPIRRNFGIESLENIRNLSLNTECFGPFAKVSLVMTEIHQVILDLCHLLHPALLVLSSCLLIFFLLLGFHINLYTGENVLVMLT